MALNGSLAEFSIPEVLQLLAMQQKSGVLSLAHDDGRRQQLFFERGYIIAAAESCKPKESAFLQALHACQHLSREQVQTVIDISMETSQDLITVLLTTGMIGRDRLADEMHRFTQYLMDDLVIWRAGTYEFSGDEKSVPAVGLVHRISTEELLMESMRRNDELETLKESLIGEEQVLAKSPSPQTQPLPRECQVVLRLIDGRRTVRDICTASPLGDWPTYDAIAELLGYQQVIILDQDQASQLLTNRSRFTVSPVAWISLIIPLALSILVGFFSQPLFTTESTTWLPQELAESRMDYKESMSAEVVTLMETRSSAENR